MTTQLKKAELQALGAGADPEPTGDPIPVQFNPSSLRLQMANSVEGGDSSARQARQYTGTSSTSLTVELIFDTADEGTAGEPVSVKERTNRIAAFLLPGEGSQEPPPRVRFHWGDFVLDGVMSALTEDIDLFSAGGVPLRSKLSITIKEQDPRFTALETGPGSGGGGQATEPGAGGKGPGTTPDDTAADSSREALGGESPAEFAARNGLDPAAWRAVAAALDGLDLPAGAQIGFSASAGASLGLGVHAGFEAGVEASLEASLGIAPAPGRSQETGFALSSAGGVNAAIARAQHHELTGASDAARRAFGTAAAPAQTEPSSGGAPRTGVGGQSSVGAGVNVSGVASTRPPDVDPRAASYGRGIPLRPRRATGAPFTVTGREQSPAPPITVDLGVPGWLALPARNVWTTGAEKAQSSLRRPSPCGHRSCDCGGSR